YRAGAKNLKTTGGKLGEPGISYAEFFKKVKEILLVSRLEVDDILSRLAKLEIIEIMEVKESVVGKDAIGRVRKTSGLLKDRRLVVKDPEKFMQVARNLSEETYTEKPPFTECLEFIDIHDFAEFVHSTPEMIYKKIGYKEFPETYFFLHKPTVEAWAAKMGEEFFQRVKRKRVKIEDLETVDDIVYVDNATLQDAFSKVGFHKMGILAGMAGDEARKKIFANLSKKIAKVVEEEARTMEDLDEMEAADAEDELLGAIKSIKGLTK
ncbi:MAG: FliG C-terminal domain-containing protein, partial [Thermodesulfobacteriota bacterium]|nr:FliG C-terminal domain-containing protein [Thermodesulfobacteriota bacterium]